METLEIDFTAMEPRLWNWLRTLVPEIAERLSKALDANISMYFDIPRLWNYVGIIAR
jgi:hypothetical protein